MAEENIEKKNTYSSKKKNVVIVVGAIVLAAVVLIGFAFLLQTILNSRKDTPEYKAAYDYLVSSQSFKEMDVDESKIRLNQYSVNKYSSIKSENVEHTAQLGFVVKFKSFVVVCHLEDGEWEVCEECTKFD